MGKLAVMASVPSTYREILLRNERRHEGTGVDSAFQVKKGYAIPLGEFLVNERLLSSYSQHKLMSNDNHKSLQERRCVRLRL